MPVQHRRVKRETTVGLAAGRGLGRSSTGWRTAAFDAGRGDFFYLADAFLHGRTWLDVPARPERRDRPSTAGSTCRSRRSRRSS